MEILGELTYSQAKTAIGRSASVAEIRTARERIAHIGQDYSLPFVADVAKELLEVYLQRRASEYEITPAARTYISNNDTGSIVYDRFEIKTPTSPLFFFGISEGYQAGVTRGVKTPEFRSVRVVAPLDQPSVTNIIHIDGVGLVVFKAFTQKTIGRLAREGFSRDFALGDPQKASIEVEQLNLLSQIFQADPLIYIPQVLGVNNAVVAIEFLIGENMADRALRGALGKQDFIKVAHALARIHHGLSEKAETIKGSFNIPYEHTANSIVNFEKKTIDVIGKEDWGKDLPPDTVRKFKELAIKAKTVIVSNPQYHKFPDIIYGDMKDENIVLLPDGRLAVFDPMICEGKKSMDIAKFARSIIFKDPQAFIACLDAFMTEYEQKAAQSPLDSQEIAQMTGIDMINIIRGYLLIPKNKVHLFPPAVRRVQDNIFLYFNIINNLLAGNLQLPSQ